VHEHSYIRNFGYFVSLIPSFTAFELLIINNFVLSTLEFYHGK
jgi:hypothetical protein